LLWINETGLGTARTKMLNVKHAQSRHRYVFLVNSLGFRGKIYDSYV